MILEWNNLIIKKSFVVVKYGEITMIKIIIISFQIVKRMMNKKNKIKAKMKMGIINDFNSYLINYLYKINLIEKLFISLQLSSIIKFNYLIL